MLHHVTPMPIPLIYAQKHGVCPAPVSTNAAVLKKKPKLVAEPEGVLRKASFKYVRALRPAFPWTHRAYWELENGTERLGGLNSSSLSSKPHLGMIKIPLPSFAAATCRGINNRPPKLSVGASPSDIHSSSQGVQLPFFFSFRHSIQPLKPSLGNTNVRSKTLSSGFGH